MHRWGRELDRCDERQAQLREKKAEGEGFEPPSPFGAAGFQVRRGACLEVPRHPSNVRRTCEDATIRPALCRDVSWSYAWSLRVDWQNIGSRSSRRRRSSYRSQSSSILSEPELREVRTGSGVVQRELELAGALGVNLKEGFALRATSPTVRSRCTPPRWMGWCACGHLSAIDGSDVTVARDAGALGRFRYVRFGARNCPDEYLETRTWFRQWLRPVSAS